MPYCMNCGKPIDGDAKFCPECGASQDPGPRFGGNDAAAQPNRSNVVVIRDKSEGIAAILSLLIPGLGQMYAGKIGRGLGFLIGFILMGVLIWVPSAAILSVEVTESTASVYLVLTVAILVAYLAAYVYCIYDAYKLAKEYNEYLIANNRKPW